MACHAEGRGFEPRRSRHDFASENLGFSAGHFLRTRMATMHGGYNVMRRATLLMCIGLCGCAADDEFRVLSYTPTGIEYSVWTGAHSRVFGLDGGPLARSRGRYGPTVLPKGRQEGADHRFRNSGKESLQRQSGGLPLQLRQLAIRRGLLPGTAGCRDELGDLAGVTLSAPACMTASDHHFCCGRTPIQSRSDSRSRFCRRSNISPISWALQWRVSNKNFSRSSR